MTFEEFDKITEEAFAVVRDMRDNKGKEYAATGDRFANFNDIAKEAGISRQQVWLIYFMKHIRSIQSFVRDNRTYSTEPIEGRIIDAITYLTLLLGMVKEDQGYVGKVPDLRAHDLHPLTITSGPIAYTTED